MKKTRSLYLSVFTASLLAWGYGSTITASAEVIFDTLPRNDQAGLIAECGQTWMTGSLGVLNNLKTIEVATRSSGAGGGIVYLAVYENNAASGSASPWSPGSLVAVSMNTQNMSQNGVVNTFNFSRALLRSNKRYLYKFVDSSTNAVSLGVGVKLNTGSAEQSVYSAGNPAFKAAHTIASRITTGSGLPLAFTGATTVQSNRTIAKVGIHGVAALEIKSSGGVPTNSITSLTYNLNGTTNPSDIEEVRLYDDGRVFDNGTAELLAVQSPTGTSGNFSVSRKVLFEKQYLWVAVKLRGTSNTGDFVDAEITNFALDGANAGTYVPDVTAAPEILTVDAAALYSMVLRKEGDDGAAFYRIPGLVTTTNGTLIAAFDIRWGGGYDLPGDMDVAVRRSTDGGISWGLMQVIMDYDASVTGSQGNGVGDPAILVDRVNGRIWCAALWSFGNNGWNGSSPGLSKESTGQLVLNYSDDDGLTWSDPLSITAEVKDPAWRLFFQGPGKGICTRDGVLIFPTQFRENDSGKTARSNFIYSTDRGMTWKVAPAATPTGTKWTSESQIVELENGDLLISMRNYDVARKQRLWCVYSWDHESQTIADGTWGAPWYDQTCPIVMASVERCNPTINGQPRYGVLFANPDSTSRERLSIRLSLDNGKTWPYKRKIDNLLAAYSCMTMLPDGDIGILYETGETSSISRLVFARFPIEWLLKTPDSVISYYEFREQCPGGTAEIGAALRDQTGSHPASVVGDALNYVAGSPAYGDIAGLQFDKDSSAKVEIPPHAEFAFHTDIGFTVEVLFKIDGSNYSSDDAPMLICNPSSGRPHWLLQLAGGIKPHFRVTATTDAYSVVPNVDAGDNQWHHIAGVFDGVKKKMMLYLDYELIQSNDIAALAGSAGSSTQPLLIGGGLTATESFGGEIDFVRISAGALDVQQFLKPGAPAEGTMIRLR
ncbi:MAG: exo-alpha-sialidase [Kiritimatiellae bacterium]|nr:exo-alpha-sialidase [Kiritimatiellia bacterium]